MMYICHIIYYIMYVHMLVSHGIARAVQPKGRKPCKHISAAIQRPRKYTTENEVLVHPAAVVNLKQNKAAAAHNADAVEHNDMDEFAVTDATRGTRLFP